MSEIRVSQPIVCTRIVLFFTDRLLLAYWPPYPYSDVGAWSGGLRRALCLCARPGCVHPQRRVKRSSVANCSAVCTLAMDDDLDFEAFAALVEGPGAAGPEQGEDDFGADFVVAELVLARHQAPEAAAARPKAPAGFAQRSPALLAHARTVKEVGRLTSDKEALEEKLAVLTERSALELCLALLWSAAKLHRNYRQCCAGGSRKYGRT